MAVKINRGTALASLNLTPLIDVVFLLLIFFLVATTFQEEEDEEKAKAENAMSVELPQASEAKPLTSRPEALSVYVDQRGQFYVFSHNKDAINRDGLLEILKQAHADNPGRQKVFIKADRRVPLEHAVVVMDLCNKANIRDYSLSTAEMPTPQQ
jgi:biopolymer transport protein ExbD